MGRPGQLVRLDGRRARFLGIQLGVVHTRLAMLPVGVREGDRWGVEIRTAGSGEKWVEEVGRGVGRMVCEREGSGPELRGAKLKSGLDGIEAVLVSVPGVVDEGRGEVLLCPNLRWAEKVKIGEVLGGLWGRPVVLVQEIRALALGHLAVERWAGDFLLVDFGDGVGGAAVVGGKLFESSIPLSGELGHTPVLGNKRQCGCGAVGCVETLVSRRGLVESFLGRRGGGEGGFRLQGSGFRGKDEWGRMRGHIERRGVERWLAEGLEAAAVTIAGAMNVLGVRKVVVTGSLTELPGCVVGYLGEAVRRGAMWGRFGEVECVGGPRRRMAGLVSAGIERILVPAEA